MASIDVVLPAGVVPVFPPTCVVCEDDTVGTLKIAQHSANPWLTFFFPVMMLFKWSRTTVPVCPECRLKFRWQRWSRWTVMMVVIFVVGIVLLPYFKDWTPTVRKIIVGAAAFAVVFPLFVLHVYWPPYFDTMADSEKIQYEFKSMYCAGLFHAANYDKVIASEVPESFVRMVLGNDGEDGDEEEEDDA